jgi:hypothetical protein
MRDREAARKPIFQVTDFQLIEQAREDHSADKAVYSAELLTSNFRINGYTSAIQED